MDANIPNDVVDVLNEMALWAPRPGAIVAMTSTMALGIKAQRALRNHGLPVPVTLSEQFNLTHTPDTTFEQFRANMKEAFGDVEATGDVNG